MIDFIRRRKNRRDFIRKQDFTINGHRIYQVHTIPDIIRENDKCELDYYLYTSYDVYLVRMINSGKNKITIEPATKICNVIYIICETAFSKDSLKSALEKVINKLELPKIKNPKRSIVIDL